MQDGKKMPTNMTKAVVMSEVMYPHFASPPRLYSDSVVLLEMALPLSRNLPLRFSKKALLVMPRIPCTMEALFSWKYWSHSKSAGELFKASKVKLRNPGAGVVPSPPSLTRPSSLGLSLQNLKYKSVP